MIEWASSHLGEHVTHKKGFAFKSKDMVEAGHPIVRVANFTRRSVDMSQCGFLRPELAAQHGSVALKEGDVVIATVGSWPTNPASVVGKTIEIPPKANGALLNQNAVRLRAHHGLEQRFMFFRLKAPDFQEFLIGTAQGSANQASIKLKDIFRFPIRLPSISEQERISNCLGAFEDKIELNRRMNETLEEMARALFRDWFVDFGPTRRQMALKEKGLAPDPAAIMGQAFPPPKAATLAPLFPAKLGDDGLPEGWETRPLSQICRFTGGSAFKKDDQGRQLGEVPFIKVSDMNLTNNERFILLANNYVDLADQPRMKFKLHAEGAIVLAKIGIALTYNRLRVLRTSTAIDNNLLSATPLMGAANTTFLFLVLSQLDFNLYAKGSALPYLNASDLAKIDFNFAGNTLAAEVERTIGPLFEKVLANANENQTLAEMRDLLLPKLMSGEIRLKGAEGLE